MGQKTNPISFRLNTNRAWQSKWFSSKHYGQFFVADIKIKRFIDKKHPLAGIERVDINRSADQVTIDILTSKPGLLIGRSGAGIAALQADLQKNFGGKFKINITEEKKPELSARLVAENIGGQITKRVAYRRAAKMAVEKVMTAGAKGVKVKIGGRLNGADIARAEKFSAGTIPLSTIKANIDYAVYHAFTTYGIIGVKVWIYKNTENGGTDAARS